MNLPHPGGPRGVRSAAGSTRTQRAPGPGGPSLFRYRGPPGSHTTKHTESMKLWPWHRHRHIFVPVPATNRLQCECGELRWNWKPPLGLHPLNRYGIFKIDRR